FLEDEPRWHREKLRPPQRGAGSGPAVRGSGAVRPRRQLELCHRRRRVRHPAAFPAGAARHHRRSRTLGACRPAEDARGGGAGLFVSVFSVSPPGLIFIPARTRPAFAFYSFAFYSFTFYSLTERAHRGSDAQTQYPGINL